MQGPGILAAAEARSGGVSGSNWPWAFTWVQRSGHQAQPAPQLRTPLKSWRTETPPTTYCSAADEPEVVDGGDSGHSGGARVGSEVGIDAGQVISTVPSVKWRRAPMAWSDSPSATGERTSVSRRVRLVAGARSRFISRSATVGARSRGRNPPFTERCRLSPIDGSGCAMWPRSRTARARPAKPFRSETPHDPVEYRPIVQALLPRSAERGQQRLHEGSPGTGQYRLLSDWWRAAVGAELPDRAGAAPAQTPERNLFRRRCDRRLRHHQ